MTNNRDEYLQVIQKLKTHPTPSMKIDKWPKNETTHVALIAALEERVPAIDNELAVSNCMTDIPMA